MTYNAQHNTDKTTGYTVLLNGLGMYYVKTLGLALAHASSFKGKGKVELYNHNTTMMVKF